MMEREEVEHWLHGAESVIRDHMRCGIEPRLLSQGKPPSEYAALAHALALIVRVELRLKGEAITDREIAEACGFIRGVLWVYGLDREVTPL